MSPPSPQAGAEHRHIVCALQVLILQTATVPFSSSPSTSALFSTIARFASPHGTMYTYTPCPRPSYNPEHRFEPHDEALDHAWDYIEYLQVHLKNAECKVNDFLSRSPSEVDEEVQLLDIRDGMFNGAYLSTEMIDGRTRAKTAELKLLEAKVNRKIVELRNKETELRRVEKDLEGKKNKMELLRPRAPNSHPPWLRMPHVPTFPSPPQMSMGDARRILMDARGAEGRLQTFKQDVARQEKKLTETETALVKANANLSDALADFKDIRNMISNM